MTFDTWHIARLVILGVFVLTTVLVYRGLRPFFWRITLCLLPLVLGATAVGNAVQRYMIDGGGFKLGVDLVGGTILVYELDADKMTEEKKVEFQRIGGADKLAAQLKHRIDPTDLYNVTIRPVNASSIENTRVEIILPTGGAHQAEIEAQDWGRLLDQVKEHWPKLKDESLESIPIGSQQQLMATIQAKTGAPVDEIETFVSQHYKLGTERKDLTSEQVQEVKNKIAQVGSLEFRILANTRDDKEAVRAAEDYFKDPKHKDELDQRALKGQPPSPPGGSRAFNATIEDKGTFPFTYSWVELGKQERFALGLNNAAEDPWKDLLERVRNNWTMPNPAELDRVPHATPPTADDYKALEEKIRDLTHAPQLEVQEFISQNQGRSSLWKQAAEARNRTMVLQGMNDALLYSRKCVDSKLTPKQREEKKYEYFLLTRDPEPGQEVTGEMLASTNPGPDSKGSGFAVHFAFNSTGGNHFYHVTSQNTPTGPEGSRFYRHLAIVLDGQIISAPRVNQAISSSGEISGSFTQKEVNDLVALLRSGALPATLKPQPVSENTMGATLGADTVKWGTISVGVAFAAILLFMLVYYRFAGLVACVALLANLLLTVAFMVIVNATFTLPGLAGLVLMLGMAVDANVLIYERLREERDRGASLALAIRNGYDRAFPTIIDTHLSSIFTAIVLYAVGNDQLKGFGISLTVGLIISLFTSLYMTRLMFDLWQARGWLRKLSMFRLFSRPNIDFMAIRYYWFTATILLTIFGISVFIARLPQGLNIDFNGGTAYGGRLVEPLDITQLRNLLSDKSQAEHLQVAAVKEIKEGETYQITYRNADATRTISLPNRPPGNTPEVREQDVKERASQLPDVSVEQIISLGSTAGTSDRFTVRTAEKAPDLVQASIVRLLGDKLEKTILHEKLLENNKEVEFSFTNSRGVKTNASPVQVATLLRRECAKEGVPEDFTIQNEGTQDAEGRFDKMLVVWKDPLPKEKLQTVVQDMKQEFQDRPLPDRLETFDKQLAQETQNRAMSAILLSWGAILLYLWFRFGSWTFGLAAVLCLIHDLFFTIGIIAFCHYIHQWAPGFATALGLQDFRIDLTTVAALLTLVGYSVNDTIVVFDRIREVRGKNPELTPQMINDSVNQTLSRTLLTSFATWLVVIVLYILGGEGVHLFAFVMVVGVIVGTYSSIYIASPLLLIFGEGRKKAPVRERQPQPAGVNA